VIYLGFKNYGIGIDESNHGRIPEIYVSVLSTNLEDLIRTTEPLIKKRKRKINLDNLISDIENMKFIVLYHQHIDTFGINSVKTPVISKLVSSYMGKINIKETTVLVDGSPLLSVQEDVHCILSKNYGERLSKSQIQFIDEADKYYGVVNLADSLAYQLNKSYRDIPENRIGPFEKNRVQFRVINESKRGNKPRCIKKLI